MGEGPFKQQIYSQFARIGQALASAKRLQVLDLLAQGPRNVEALADEIGVSVANVSQHLQALKNARLVESEREGTKIIYRLADMLVLRLWLTLQAVGKSRLAEVDQLTRSLDRSNEPPVRRDELERLVEAGKVLLIDVRPAIEYEHGHIPGAVSIPVDELMARLIELPRDRPIVAYCRGEYCLKADEAVATLKSQGFTAYRLDGGWPEWWAEGRPISESGDSNPCLNL